MKPILTLFAVAVLPMLSMSAGAQSPQPPPPLGDYPAHVGPYDNASDFSKSFRVERRGSTPYREDRIVKKGLLAPSAIDRQALREFLRLPDTGLIRLLPRENANSEEVRKEIHVAGSGAYYSFHRHTHEYGYSSDIQLERDQLSVGLAGADYGIMRQMGDVPLETIRIADPQAYFIATYNPPSPEQEARSEGLRFRRGLMLDGVTYRAILPVEVSSSYLLRSVSYGRSDILVAFRIIRKDTDGSVTIAWKLLKNYPAPILLRTN